MPGSTVINGWDFSGWVNLITAMLGLAIPVAQVVAFIRQHLAPEDADAVLREALAGWQAMRAENEARIAELEALVR